MVTISDDDDAVVVSITTLENEASTTISEADNEIMLLLKLSRSINQPLQVNLSSVGDPGLASGVRSPVDVPANRMTQQFTVSDIDDLIVAQPDRNIRISVITRAGYTASTVSTSVIVNVIDDDTATVTISPVRTPITAGEDAEFEVVLGLVTAVNIDIGIDVEYGGAFITDQERVRKTVMVPAGQTSALLTVQTMENTGIAENSSLVATLRAVSHTDLEIGDPLSARVEINALPPLSITATPVSVSLVEMEGGDSTQISVRVNRIPEGSSSVTVTINLPEGSGLNVMPSSLEFTGTETRTVTVEVPSDNRYIGDRNVMLTFAADDYAMATVAVNITEDDPQPIELMVVGSTELDLVRFASTEITVSVEVATTLNVETEGSVVLADGVVSRYDLTEGALSQQIQIRGDNVGEGTVTFTVGEGRTADTAVVTVMVSTPSLVITGVPTPINLVTQETTVVIVSVRAEAGEPDNVVLGATIDGTGVAEVSLGTTNVQADMTTATVTVTGFNVDGETTLTLMASHIDYEPESIEVPVNVDLRSIELSVMPSPLEIVSGMSAELTITATPAVTITIISGDAGIASVPGSAAAFMLMGGAENSTEITVIGGSTGTTTLMIEASMAGYTTETATVNVEVLDPLLIEVMPATFDLTEGENIQINVNPNLIRDVTTVTISIEATTGTTGLTVMPSSLEFTGTEMRTATVTATNDNVYTGDRNATLTLTATGYATETVPIRILDNDLVVTVTRPDGESLISVNEGSDVDLVINVDPSVPDLRDLDVNLSYTNITDTLETISITVPAGRTSQSFSIPAGDDEIAAQATRTFNVLIEQDSSYGRGDPFEVGISVLNEDSAVVSISAASGPVGEDAEEAQFEVQVSNEIATSLTVSIEFTTMGEFEISPSSAVVVIAAGETTALLTVGTIDDDIDEPDGSLRATINSLTPLMPVSGVEPAIGVNSATVTILDNDLLRVSITNQSSMTISEDTDIRLLLTLSDAINRDLPVTLNYMAEPGLLDTGVERSVVVPSGMTTHTFTVPIINDEIAAQSTRNINISVATGLGYTASTVPVTVNVIDDDVATVSISRVRDRVIEGDTIVFTITRDLATAQASSISLTLTHNGDFFSAATPTLNFGDNYEETGINLSLIARHKRDGKVYYYLNHHNLSAANFADRITHALLDNLLNGRNDTTDTQEPGRHDGSDDARSVIIDGYALILPTLTEIQAFRAAENFVAPDGWANSEFYWSATILPGSNDMHHRISLHNSDMASSGRDNEATDRSYVFFQVLTAQRTIIVDLPAGQMDIMVEVATIDTDDSITDGSLIAELIAVTSPIELGSTVSEVVILNNNLEVTVTGLNGESSVDVDEDSNVNLRINVDSPVPDRRDLNVNLSYTNITGTPETRSITVFAGNTSQSFSIPAGNDDIAAQATRTFNVW